MIFERPVFSWTEPLSSRVRRTIGSLRVNWKSLLLSVATAVALCWLAIFYVAAIQGRHPHLGFSAVIAFITVVVGFSTLLAVLSMMPTTVLVYPDRLVVSSSKKSTIPFVSISYCELTREQLTGLSLPVFEVFNTEGRCAASVLWDMTTPFEDLRAALQSKQVNLQNRL